MGSPGQPPLCSPHLGVQGRVCLLFPLGALGSCSLSQHLLVGAPGWGAGIDADCGGLGTPGPPFLRETPDPFLFSAAPDPPSTSAVHSWNVCLTLRAPLTPLIHHQRVHVTGPGYLSVHISGLLGPTDPQIES